MKLIQVADYEEMSRSAAELVYTELENIRTLGLATGGTPLGFYEALRERVRQEGRSLQHLHTVNLDEYLGLAADHPQSYHYYMNEVLFQHTDIPSPQTHLPAGDAEDPYAEAARYDELVTRLGVDLQLLGVGANGHIGFNEPGSSFHGRTDVVRLAEGTIRANARFFGEGERVPEQAVTMGIGTILESRRILLLASGARKAEAVRALLHGAMSEEMPVTALQTHPDVTVIADEAALSLSR
ncbi:glucosamine-6-phosphate deaminase [Alkalicoccus urumqiensis]|uniref:Glucosamine-6-phosphate deaminase n=1 Tax=Alkalicoccus urumqiensis TaxID=1548213 RepID=A0A2P6MLN2_ALKUR|nr:glucosamine-6-phosphate deaminase [Alkalicoccus urumqiensis]PRO67194.1 glucosamine-6-phosphate deaminase [Alkalicoccus urumqiensis]